mmetsp:Transcript_26292/g.27367  ORF Transcript_26292/g.27367 Transcript_26292/m.27367 type:complete len:83 (+) Transcript_26292:225-473(+)
MATAAAAKRKHRETFETLQRSLRKFSIMKKLRKIENTNSINKSKKVRELENEFIHKLRIEKDHGSLRELQNMGVNLTKFKHK